MNWYEILIAIVGAVGGSAGIVALLKFVTFAKPERKSKEIENKGSEIGNKSAEIENLTKVIDALHKELDYIKADFKTYKEEVDKRVIFFKGQYEHLEVRLDILHQALSEAYRCPFPQTLEDCPVMRYLNNRKKCEECKKRLDGDADCDNCNKIENETQD